MKPLFTLTILSKDPMDPTKHKAIGEIAFEYPGKASLILSRDEMGEIKTPDAPVFTPDDAFVEMLDEATKTLGELHAKLGETHIATNHALTDMFAIHKRLTG